MDHGLIGTNYGALFSKKNFVSKNEWLNLSTRGFPFAEFLVLKRESMSNSSKLNDYTAKCCLI